MKTAGDEVDPKRYQFSNATDVTQGSAKAPEAAQAEI
jgi:hypothetical protein